jgi:hypothetical protein
LCGKKQGNFSLCLLDMTPWAYMGGVAVHLHSFLNLTLDGGERLTSHPHRRSLPRPEKMVTVNFWIGAWLGGAQNSYERLRELTNLLFLSTIKPRLLGRSALM